MNNPPLKAVLRKDFLAFARKAILGVEGTKIDKDPYLEYLTTELTDFIDGPTNRQIVNLPPRHLKTKLFSICLAAWRLAHDPFRENHGRHIFGAACGKHRPRHTRHPASGVVQANLRDENRQGPSAVMDFGTTAGGQLYAASFSGSITGRGADLIIIDDPHDIKDAGSLDQLERTADIFNTIVMSRLNNRKTGKVVVIAHRIHENDLSARLLRQGNWRHLALPMVAITDTEHETNYGPWRRRKGELLRPGAYGPADLEELRANTHNPGFELLYQQDVDGLALPSIARTTSPSSALRQPKSAMRDEHRPEREGRIKEQLHRHSGLASWTAAITSSINGARNAATPNFIRRRRQ